MCGFRLDFFVCVCILKLYLVQFCFVLLFRVSLENSLLTTFYAVCYTNSILIFLLLLLYLSFLFLHAYL